MHFAFLLAGLQKLYQNNDLVFCTEFGKPIEPCNFTRKFYSLIKKANIPDANFHCLRHTFSTRTLEAGIPAKVVSEMLGHANIAITPDLYSHVMTETKRAVADKLNVLFEKKKTV